MYLDIKKIRKLLADDKRKCDRLNLAAKISHSSSLSSEWSWPLDAENIGGGGAQFKSSKSLTKGKKLKLKIEFPDLGNPLYINSTVAWCKKEIKKNTTKKKTTKSAKQLPVYTVGVRFLKSHQEDRHLFVKYLSEKIFTEYLDIIG